MKETENIYLSLKYSKLVHDLNTYELAKSHDANNFDQLKNQIYAFLKKTDSKIPDMYIRNATNYMCIDLEYRHINHKVIVSFSEPLLQFHEHGRKIYISVRTKIACNSLPENLLVHSLTKNTVYTRLIMYQIEY